MKINAVRNTMCSIQDRLLSNLPMARAQEEFACRASIHIASLLLRQYDIALGNTELNEVFEKPCAPREKTDTKLVRMSHDLLEIVDLFVTSLRSGLYTSFKEKCKESVEKAHVVKEETVDTGYEVDAPSERIHPDEASGSQVPVVRSRGVIIAEVKGEEDDEDVVEIETEIKIESMDCPVVVNVPVLHAPPAKKIAPSSRLLTCPFCRTTFASIEDLDDHHIEVHGYERLMPYGCKVCDASTKTIAEMTAHRARDGCDGSIVVRAFPQSLAVQQGTASTSIDKEAGHVVCPHCRQPFVHRYAMANHVVKLHPDQPPLLFGCSACSYNSPEMYDAEQHLLRQKSRSDSRCIRGRLTVEAPLEGPEYRGLLEAESLLGWDQGKIRTCPTCNVYFSSVHALEYHMRSCHTPPNPLFGCGQCNFFTTTVIQLCQHFEKNCDWSQLVIRSALSYRQMRREIGASPNPLKNRGMNGPAGRICPYCENDYMSSYSLDDHIRERHLLSRQSLFGCSDCHFFAETLATTPCTGKLTQRPFDEEGGVKGSMAQINRRWAEKQGVLPQKNFEFERIGVRRIMKRKPEDQPDEAARTSR